MRILHTSDWHLGLSTGPASRSEEQELFLEWLLKALADHEVDALLVAGDVFDSMHPSAEAQALYYRFLARVSESGVQKAVVIGGNHDSPSGLDAPNSLLQEVGAHVVGGLPPLEDRLDPMLVPLRVRGHEDPAAVCLAVPYVHEYRLGVRTTDLDREQTRDAFKAAFQDLYSSLADRAVERFGELPLIAMGHLTLGAGSTRDDYPQEVHQVGTIEGLPAEILDQRISYGALGHIHRCYRIGDGPAWYCGSPIPYSVAEAKTPRHVLLVDVDEKGKAKVERLEVPLSRSVVPLTGPAETVLAELGGLTWSTPLPPLVHVRVETQLAVPGLQAQLHEVVSAHEEGKRPILVEVQQRAAEAAGGESPPAAQPLDELEPRAVFELLCDARGLDGEERENLLVAFDSLASADPGTLDKMIEGVPRPAASESEPS